MVVTVSAPLDRPVSSLPVYLEATHELGARSARRRLWFRGVHDARYALVPRLYRSDAGVEELQALEREMFAEFRSRSRSLLAPDIASDWERMFVMQHYGVPTRLLDWSENAFYALYFALSGAAERGFTTDAAVWVMDPAGWNRATFPTMQAPGNALCVGEAALDPYEPGRKLEEMGDGAAALWGLYNNPRITAQRGVFTVLGRSKSSLQDLFEAQGLPQSALVCLRLPKSILGELNDQVRLLGFRESMIYPDLGGLATEIRVEHGLP
jgi:FRG domain-containing protein